MQNNLYIVIDEQFIAGPVTMEKPYKHHRTDFEFMSDEEIGEDAEAWDKWEQHLASIPRIARADNGKWKQGQDLREGVDFEIRLQTLSYDEKTWHNTNFSTTQLTYAERPFRHVAIPIEQSQPISAEDWKEKVAGILYANKTDEADEGSWIESKDFYKVAGLIADALASTQQNRSGEQEELFAAMLGCLKFTKTRLNKFGKSTCEIDALIERAEQPNP